MINKITKPQFKVPINEYVLKLIEEKFNGEPTLKFNGKNLKKDSVVYLCFLLTKHQAKTEIDGNSAFPLYSKLLKTDFVYDYKQYLVFLEKENILCFHTEHDTFSGLSRIYSISDFTRRLPVSLNVTIKIVRYPITDNIILKKVNIEKSLTLSEYHLERNKKCEEKRNHFLI